MSGGRTDGGRLRGDGGGGSSDEDSLRTDLRQRLQEEASLYRRRLDTYRQAQQNQAALVSRLQAKVNRSSHRRVAYNSPRNYLGSSVQAKMCGPGGATYRKRDRLRSTIVPEIHLSCCSIDVFHQFFRIGAGATTLAGDAGGANNRLGYCFEEIRR